MSDYKGKISNINDSARIWLHRCNHYGKAAWIMLGYNYDNNAFSDENGCYISVGCGSGTWSVQEYNFIKNSTDMWKEFEEKYNKSKPRYRYFLYRFFYEFKKDDYIVIPSSGEFHVFQIESDAMLTYDDQIIKDRFNKIGLNPEEIKQNKHDFKFFRKVKPVRVQIPRKGYAVGELSSKLKYQGTTLEITDNAADLLKNALIADKPFSIYDASIEELKKKLYDNALTKITPENLESLITWYFKKKGADIYDVLPKNYAEKVADEDADVIAIFEDLKIRIFVQAKAYVGNMNLSNAEEQLKKYMNYHVLDFNKKYTDIKWIVCLATSDNDIKDSGIIKDIRIINGMEFAEMLLNAGLQNIDEVLI